MQRFFDGKLETEKVEKEEEKEEEEEEKEENYINLLIFYYDFVSLYRLWFWREVQFRAKRSEE